MCRPAWLALLCLAVLLQFSIRASSASLSRVRAGAAEPQLPSPDRTSSSRSLMQSLNTRYQKPYNICTSDWAPIVRCADIEDPAQFDGFQIQLWRDIAADLGWSDDDWFFSCVDWSAMIEDLVSPTGNCSFAPAGVEVSLENIVAGLKFSWPIYKSGFRVLVASHMEDEGTWAFAQAFDWSVWVVLGATAVVTSILVTAAEALTYGNRANRKGLRGWSWYTMGKVVQVPTHVGDPKTWASRVLVLGYAFLVLIMVHLFTATTASKLTMQRLANDITGKQDLPGKKVMSWEPYVPLLRKYSIDATAMPWDNDADTEVMLQNLRTNKYKALILDSPVVQHFAAQAEHCDLFPVGDAFETFNLAIAFPPDVTPTLPQDITASIVRLQTTRGLLDELENIHIRGEGAATSHACRSFDSQADHKGIDLHQVLGLWYILLITLAVAVVMLAWNVISRKRLLSKCWRGGTAMVAGAAGATGAAAACTAEATAAAEVQHNGDGGVAVVTCLDAVDELAEQKSRQQPRRPAKLLVIPGDTMSLGQQQQQQHDGDHLGLPGAAAESAAASPAAPQLSTAATGSQGEQQQERAQSLLQQQQQPAVTSARGVLLLQQQMNVNGQGGALKL